MRKYRKVEEFWLPASDETRVEILLFGRSIFTIQHSDYRITHQPSAVGNASHANSLH